MYNSFNFQEEFLGVAGGGYLQCSPQNNIWSELKTLGIYKIN